MTATAQEVFTETVRALPPSEQFRLAALILQELSEVVVVKRSDTWSEQNQSDLTAAALQYAAKLCPEEAVAAADAGRGSGGYFGGGTGDGGAVERETEGLLAEIIGDGSE